MHCILFAQILIAYSHLMCISCLFTFIYSLLNDKIYNLVFFYPYLNSIYVYCKITLRIQMNDKTQEMLQLEFHYRMYIRIKYK